MTSSGHNIIDTPDNQQHTFRVIQAIYWLIREVVILDEFFSIFDEFFSIFSAVVNHIRCHRILCEQLERVAFDV